MCLIINNFLKDPSLVSYKRVYTVIIIINNKSYYYMHTSRTKGLGARKSIAYL